MSQFLCAERIQTPFRLIYFTGMPSLRLGSRVSVHTRTRSRGGGSRQTRGQSCWHSGEDGKIVTLHKASKQTGTLWTKPHYSYNHHIVMNAKASQQAGDFLVVIASDGKHSPRVARELRFHGWGCWNKMNHTFAFSHRCCVSVPKCTRKHTSV